jgi:hypothetical protein
VKEEIVKEALAFIAAIAVLVLMFLAHPRTPPLVPATGLVSTTASP